MNQQTIDLVQQSWVKVAAIAPQAAALFYQNLFTADPGLQPLFKGTMDEQGHKLTQMLATCFGIYQRGEIHVDHNLLPTRL